MDSKTRRLRCFRRWFLRLLVCGPLLLLASWLLFFVVLLTGGGPPETECSQILQGTVVFAPAFSNLGSDPADPERLRPGAANQEIAAKLEQCAARFALVFTQKAVSDALEDPTQLADGTPVAQMHKHKNESVVRTLEAFACAANRLDAQEPIPAAVVAHDRHMFRSFQALAAVLSVHFPGSPIQVISLGETSFEKPGCWPPLEWAARETMARPVQTIQVLLGRQCGFSCSPEVTIEEMVSYPVISAEEDLQ